MSKNIILFFIMFSSYLTNAQVGENVYGGKDHTLHARVDGIVKFTKKRDNKSYVSIVPFEA